ncbi:regulator of chromosome condensation 1/beta-lactamase-inhibitor protein II [Aspergillus pseudocaelatus]|uniref:Regulator of chromosome condensation 1/beta-lactamase-inhibitor protein II n=1 Tax=Aspergillus pseudocaelatus TaxID=1825620 RepID=A0ABQ6WBV9_9EURO|nr:regulator of chromosome condensation 1/beta-lactamase-inhibitor protein II [Aspergillus pseudocaelatus]
MPPQRRASSTGQKNKSAGDAKRQKPNANAKSALASRERKRHANLVGDERPELRRKDPKRRKEQPVLQNRVPTQLLDVYVFGTNCYGELGLGDLTKKSEIVRPVLNQKLAADSVGVVHLTVGGVHSAALTHDNRILTWGVNDEGTLGRDTKQEKEEETERDGANNVKGETESGQESDDDDITLNMNEATPQPVNPSLFPKGTVFAQLAASDSATFALTTKGLVYGWGTFRGANGGIGFGPENKKEQRTPVQIPILSDVVKIVAGAQHILALTSNGTVFSWGCDEQHQLGRRRASRRHQSHPLVPDQCALPSGIEDIGVGSYHSFAVHRSGAVYAWGSNNFGQTAVPMSAGHHDATVAFPTEVRAFRKYGKVVKICGGKDHSIAITALGRCLTWGRIDNKALGMGAEEMPLSDIIYDEYSRPRILKQPHMLSGISDRIVFATTASDHSFVITEAGKAYSWGFNVQSQAGHPGLDEVEKPTLLQSKYVDGNKLVSAAAGGQFSIVMGKHLAKTTSSHS